MSNNANNVSVGKPMVGGAVFRAPSGTALPTSANATLAAAYINMGYISEDGVTNNNERETADIKAWGGDKVLTSTTGRTDSFGMTFIESINTEVLKAVYGDSNVSGTLASGIAVSSNSDELENAVWVIDMILTNNVIKRIVIPNGKISETGEVTYKDDTAIGYNVTITAFPGADGDTHKEYIIQGE